MAELTIKTLNLFAQIAKPASQTSLVETERETRVQATTRRSTQSLPETPVISPPTPTRGITLPNTPVPTPSNRKERLVEEAKKK